MSLLPVEASFEEIIQDCFLAYRGTGLMLNALDAELLSGWALQAVPVEVVARGIRIAAEKAGWDGRPDEAPLRSLRQCRRWVDAEITRFKRATAGAGEAPSKTKTTPEARWWKATRKTVEALKDSRPDLQPALTRLLEGPLVQAPRSPEQLAWVEDLLWATVLRALPYSQRRPLLQRVQAKLHGTTTPRARRLALRWHRGLAVKAELKLAG
jgi:hypothetical protein